MSEAANRRAVERLFEGINAGDVSVMNDVFTDDSEIVYPQSGELIRGRANRQGVYESSTNLPSVAPYRTVASGDIVVVEAMLDYGGDKFQTVFVFEFRDARIFRETVYWSKPFPAAESRARWVEKIEPAK
jgi:ketosteroid isomerase-like protein